MKTREEILEYKRQYREKNKEEILKKAREYRLKNKEKIKEYKKNNREKINDTYRKYIKKRKENDVLFKISYNVRRLVSLSIRKQKYSKKTKAHEILGCSFEDFKKHIESLWEDWMNWDNYGLYNGELNYGWDIDHIIPNSSAMTEEEIIKLNHYTNLKPLCSYVNRYVKKNTPQS